MGVADTLDVLWILKKCIWCGFHIKPDDLEHTVDIDPIEGTVVRFQHRNRCPDVDPLEK